MTTATIQFGTADNPGLTVECSDSLSEIKTQLDKGWKDGYWLAVVEADGFRLIAEKPRNGVIKLRPSQRG